MKTKRKMPARKTGGQESFKAKESFEQSLKKTSKQAPKKAPKKTSPKAAKEIVQFAPNFTAYVLPPATICLYSEHRKFFLHGELYVAIAEAIGKNGKETQGLIDELSRKYPVDQIQEGLKRLYERRYVTHRLARHHRPRRRLLGEPRPAARRRRAEPRRTAACSVEAIDVKGAKELTVRADQCSASASSPARPISPSRWSTTISSVGSPS